MNYEEFLRRVRQRTGLDLAGAEQAVAVTFTALGRRLDSLDPPEPFAVVEIAAMLPRRLAALLRAGASAASPARFPAGRGRVSPGFAKAHAQAVLGTLAGMLDERRRLALCERLPAEVAALLQPLPSPPAPPRVSPPRVGRAPADSRSGTKHPHSVASSADPRPAPRPPKIQAPSPERARDATATDSDARKRGK